MNFLKSAAGAPTIAPRAEISLAYSAVTHYNITTYLHPGDNPLHNIRSQPMDLVMNFIDILLHLDKYLHEVILRYGGWTYLIFFITIFCETGLVVTPFLPGDSLLFIAGTFCALGSLHLGWLLLILSAAAILGNTVNYAIGSYIGPRVFYMEDSRFFKKAYLERTHAFFEKYGPMTIVIGRFLPIIRTFAPFLAGVGSMSYGRFLTYNVVGCVLWIFLFTLGGYFFGTIPVVKNNFTLVIVIILFVSILPTLIEVWRQRRLAKSPRMHAAVESNEPTRQQ
jgi:membrane-associated protein